MPRTCLFLSACACACAYICLCEMSSLDNVVADALYRCDKYNDPTVYSNSKSPESADLSRIIGFALVARLSFKQIKSQSWWKARMINTDTPLPITHLALYKKLF